MSKEDDAALRDALATIGRRGGFARAKGMTKRERSEGASLAAKARWAAVKKAAAAAKKKEAKDAKLKGDADA